MHIKKRDIKVQNKKKNDKEGNHVMKTKSRNIIRDVKEDEWEHIGY